MLAVVYSASLIGIDAQLVEVEVDISPGLPQFIIVGLPDATVKESKERVVSAIKNAGFSFPQGKIIVNLAPADLKKEGSAFDLPIALGILSAGGIIEEKNIRHMAVGELSLEGSVRPVAGVLPSAILAASLDETSILVPEENGTEAAAVPGIQAYTLEHISQAPAFFNDGERKQIKPCYPSPEENSEMDFCYIKGQEHAKRALEIAVTGGHNLLMIGAPGSGKSMMAKSLPTIFPPLNFDEALETTRIYSVRGYTSKDNPLILSRPFRAPHHSASEVGIIGGGSNPMPGEVSLAHNGVLFLDELTEFKRNLIDTLRQPLEDKKVSISRARQSVTFPADFMLVAACNPCPCGNRNHPFQECICSPLEIKRYMGKLSAPILDRIDLQVEVNPLKEKDLSSTVLAESSSAIRKRVEKAVALQEKRFARSSTGNNAGMTEQDLKEYCSLQADAKNLLLAAVQRYGLSARSYNRMLKVSRTIADLAGSEEITSLHIAEAVQYRCRGNA